jgi:regulatory protein
MRTMGKVTAVKAKGRSERWTVFLDGEAWIVADAELRTRFSLHAGEEVSAEAKAQAEAGAKRLAAHDRAMRMLAARGRSEKDLARRLKDKGVDEANAREAVERLARAGLVDDASFAKHYARQKASSGHGRRRIAMELARQGVNQALTREALDDTFSDEGVDADGSLERLAERRWKGMVRLEPEARRRRMVSFLARRGHGMDAIRRVLARLGDRERE